MPLLTLRSGPGRDGWSLTHFHSIVHRSSLCPVYRLLWYKIHIQGSSCSRSRSPNRTEHFTRPAKSLRASNNEKSKRRKLFPQSSHVRIAIFFLPTLNKFFLNELINDSVFIFFLHRIWFAGSNRMGVGDRASDV